MNPLIEQGPSCPVDVEDGCIDLVVPECNAAKRSPSRPAGSIAAARTRKYPEENHCRSDSDASSAFASVGRATLRTVLSMPTHKIVTNTAPSAHHLRDPTPRGSATVELMACAR